MARLEEHPTVQRHRERAASAPRLEPGEGIVLEAAWLRRIALDAGADDVGFVEIDRPEIADQRTDILRAFPHARTLVSFVRRMNRESLRTPQRSVANVEFHHTTDEVDEIGRRLVETLERRGVRALNPAAGFPMEMERFPGKVWVVSHKPVAAAAGLGRIGIHRNLIHPTFGSFVILGTVLVDASVDAYSTPVDYNPCLECKLCVAACPTGAIEPDGHFNFSSCYTHNYREFMGGFTDWVEGVAQSGSAVEYRKRTSDAESASMWQSLSFGANYKAAYCLAVCPAGEDVIGPFLGDRKRFLKEVVRPLQDRRETIYVVPGSDAEEYVTRRLPHKAVKRVGNGLRPSSIAGFLGALPIAFQRHRARGLAATYHFTFTGEEERTATVVIRDETIHVQDGHEGTPDIRITAESRSWIAYLAKERHIAWLLLSRRLRIKGPPRLLVAFGRCFP